jgi:glycerophosphoryl diester phosphodiesterase
MNFLKLFEKRTLLGAHRGANSVAPENTLLAMKKSLGKCDFIEIDVTLSRDGVAVVFHDDTLERTTNVENLEVFKNREPYNVGDFTYEELNSLDYGNGQKLLSLKIALEFVRENSIYLNIELKDLKKRFEDKTVVSIVLEEIASAKVSEQVLISSFVCEYLPLVKEMSPNIPTALLIEDSIPQNLVERLRNLKVDACHLAKTLLSYECLMELREAGFYVGAYVVNDEKEQEYLTCIGVNLIITDCLLQEELLHSDERCEKDASSLV